MSDFFSSYGDPTGEDLRKSAMQDRIDQRLYFAEHPEELRAQIESRLDTIDPSRVIRRQQAEEANKNVLLKTVEGAKDLAWATSPIGLAHMGWAGLQTGANIARGAATLPIMLGNYAADLATGESLGSHGADFYSRLQHSKDEGGLEGVLAKGAGAVTLPELMGPQEEDPQAKEGLGQYLEGSGRLSAMGERYFPFIQGMASSVDRTAGRAVDTGAVLAKGQLSGNLFTPPGVEGATQEDLANSQYAKAFQSGQAPSAIFEDLANLSMAGEAVGGVEGALAERSLNRLGRAAQEYENIRPGNVDNPFVAGPTTGDIEIPQVSPQAEALRQQVTDAGLNAQKWTNRADAAHAVGALGGKPVGEVVGAYKLPFKAVSHLFSDEGPVGRLAARPIESLSPPARQLVEFRNWMQETGQKLKDRADLQRIFIDARGRQVEAQGEMADTFNRARRSYEQALDDLPEGTDPSIPNRAGLMMMHGVVPAVEDALGTAQGSKMSGMLNAAATAFEAMGLERPTAAQVEEGLLARIFEDPLDREAFRVAQDVMRQRTPEGVGNAITAGQGIYREGIREPAQVRFLHGEGEAKVPTPETLLLRRQQLRDEPLSWPVKEARERIYAKIQDAQKEADKLGDLAAKADARRLLDPESYKESPSANARRILADARTEAEGLVQQNPDMAADFLGLPRGTDPAVLVEVLGPKLVDGSIRSSTAAPAEYRQVAEGAKNYEVPNINEAQRARKATIFAAREQTNRIAANRAERLAEAQGTRAEEAASNAAEYLGQQERPVVPLADYARAAEEVKARRAAVRASQREVAGRGEAIGEAMRQDELAGQVSQPTLLQGHATYNPSSDLPATTWREATYQPKTVKEVDSDIGALRETALRHTREKWVDAIDKDIETMRAEGFPSDIKVPKFGEEAGVTTGDAEQLLRGNVPYQKAWQWLKKSYGVSSENTADAWAKQLNREYQMDLGPYEWFQKLMDLAVKKQEVETWANLESTKRKVYSPEGTVRDRATGEKFNYEITGERLRPKGDMPKWIEEDLVADGFDRGELRAAFGAGAKAEQRQAFIEARQATESTPHEAEQAQLADEAKRVTEVTGEKPWEMDRAQFEDFVDRVTDRAHAAIDELDAVSKPYEDAYRAVFGEASSPWGNDLPKFTGHKALDDLAAAVEDKIVEMNRLIYDGVNPLIHDGESAMQAWDRWQRQAELGYVDQANLGARSWRQEAATRLGMDLPDAGRDVRLAQAVREGADAFMADIGTPTRDAYNALGSASAKAVYDQLHAKFRSEIAAGQLDAARAEVSRLRSASTEAVRQAREQGRIAGRGQGEYQAGMRAAGESQRMANTFGRRADAAAEGLAEQGTYRTPEQQVRAVFTRTQRQAQRLGEREAIARKAEREYARAEGRVARLQGSQERVLREAMNDPASAPARYSGMQRARYAVRDELMQLSAQLRELAKTDPSYEGQADLLELYANGISNSVFDIRDLASPEHLIGTRGRRTANVPVSEGASEMPKLQTTGASKFKQREQGTINYNPVDLLHAEVRRRVQGIVNDAVREVQERFGVRGQEFAPGLRGQEMVNAAGERDLVAWNQYHPGSPLDLAHINEDTIFLPKHVASMATKYTNEFSAPEKFLANLYDKRFLAVVKAGWLALSPRWLVTNIMGNTLMGMVGGGVMPWDMARYMWMARKMLAEEPTEGGLLSGYKQRRWEKGQAFEDQIAEEYGIRLPKRALNRGFTHEEAVTLMPELADQQLGRFRKLLAKSYGFNEYVDNVTRSAVFLSKAFPRAEAWNAIEAAARDHTDGKITMDEYQAKVTKFRHDIKTMPTQEQALKVALKAAGDFSRLSYLERNVVKRLWIFYPWYRHITKLVLSLPLEHPARVVWLMHLTDLFTPDEEKHAKGQLEGALHLQGNSYLPMRQWSPFYGGLESPFFTPQGAVSTLTPALTWPWAIMTGRNPSQGGDPFKLAPGFSDYDEFGRPTAKPLWKDPKQLGYWGINQFPLGRSATDALWGGYLQYADGRPVLVNGRPVPTGKPENPAVRGAVSVFGLPYPTTFDRKAMLMREYQRLDTARKERERYDRRLSALP